MRADVWLLDGGKTPLLGTRSLWDSQVLLAMRVGFRLRFEKGSEWPEDRDSVQIWEMQLQLTELAAEPDFSKQ